MSKLDYSRDYYADLELPPTADINEVKRQFKKLALKYHPDRNLGHEDEFTDKFQAIQSAHEILSDPATKAKFDENRRHRTGRYPTSSAPRSAGNPYQNVSKNMAEQFGSPPKRRPPTRPTPSTSSSSRYSTWGQPPTAKKTENATENLRAWDRMRTGPTNRASQASAAAAAPPNNPRPNAKNMDPPPPPPRSAAQARREEAKFGTGTRKKGFVPASPLGDEPPVRNSHYSTGLHSNVFEEVSANLKKDREAHHVVDPLMEQFNEPRQSTPYASHLGEKTNPFEGVSMSRAKSVRDGWHSGHNTDGETPPLPPQRQRSASVGESDSFKKPSAEKSAFGTAAASHRFGFPSQAGDKDGPRSAEANSAPPTATFANPGSSSSTINSTTVDGGASSNATTGPNVYATFFKSATFIFKPSQTSSLSSSAQKTPHPSGRVGVDSNGGKWQEIPSGETKLNGEAAPSGNSSPSTRELNSFEKSLQNQLEDLLSVRGTPPSKQQSASGYGCGVKPKGSCLRVGTRRTNATHRVRFSVPDDDDDETFNPNLSAQQARFMRNSTDNINTQFVPDETGGGRYKFNAGSDSSGDDAFLRAKQRSRTTTRGRQSPLKNGMASLAESVNNASQQEAGKKPGGFDPSQWEEKLGPHLFAHPTGATGGKAASPTRPVRPAKKQRPFRAGNAFGTATVVDDDETSGDDQARPTAPAMSAADISGARSPNAMDIDTPPPEPAASQPTSARTINVEPSKPEWRAGDVNGVRADANLGSGLNIMHKVNPNAAGSEDSEEFRRPIFAEFRNVEPFMSKPSGLNSLSDMASNLPFESKPSAKIPLEKAKPKPVSFPHPPAAPRPPPSFAIATPKPKSAMWASYARDFEKYLRDWPVFNKNIADHFFRRQQMYEQLNAEGYNWIVSKNDVKIEEYIQWLEQDKRVRQKWMAACDAHELHVREFQKIREQVRQQ
ncbi:hypothetical protein B0T24DRAFT_693064 [Lasiosphaeria ovina]|uniref:J domain-containing protein n=1 Tax=Lasiosphaeria ovina TaxID=92902 RepID=A0AAE0JS01_9PEZI|nr:hypothetical protein B0T24DRAFT_693064 [Lasiosphaeria ovina]